MIWHREQTIQGIFDIAFSLIGLIPYLLAVYTMISIHAGITQGILLIAAAALCSHLLGLIVLRRSGDELRELSNKARMAITGQKRAPVRIQENAPVELSDLARSFNSILSDMDKSVRKHREVATKMMLYARDIETYQQRLREEALIRARLSRYVGDNIVERIVRTGGDMPLRNEVREATILFTDIRSFTSLSEHMRPEEIIAMLNEYFDAMVDIVFEYHGVLDKFVGDELMAVFGIIDADDQAPENAIRAALAMQDRLRKMMARRKEEDRVVFEIGIGINTGRVVVGNVGSKNRMDYTVIGDAVNIAARFEQMAESGGVIIGEKTKQRSPAGFQFRAREGVRIRNRDQPVKCYDVTAA